MNNRPGKKRPETHKKKLKTKSQATWISRRISLKSKNLFPGRWRNSPHSSPPSGESGRLGLCTSCRTSGRRVQISDPRGKKSRPTSASRTLDLPLLWLPTTATWGRWRSTLDELSRWAIMSCSRFTIGIKLCPIAPGDDAACATVASSAIRSCSGERDRERFGADRRRFSENPSGIQRRQQPSREIERTRGETDPKLLRHIGAQEFKVHGMTKKDTKWITFTRYRTIKEHYGEGNLVKLGTHPSGVRDLGCVACVERRCMRFNLNRPMMKRKCVGGRSWVCFGKLCGVVGSSWAGVAPTWNLKWWDAIDIR